MLVDVGLGFFKMMVFKVVRCLGFGSGVVGLLVVIVDGVNFGRLIGILGFWFDRFVMVFDLLKVIVFVMLNFFFKEEICLEYVVFCLDNVLRCW